MKKKFLLLFAVALFLNFFTSNAQETKKETPLVDTRIDNMGYWKKLAAEGLVPVQPPGLPPKAVYKSSKLNARGVSEDSPDVPVSNTGNDTQSETSIFVNPNDVSKVFNSNNSTSWNGSSVGTLFGTSSFLSDDFGVSWGGSVQGTGGSNSGDPATIIGLNGRYFDGFIHSNSGQGVAYSDDEGVTWTSVVAGAPTGGTILDKNHLWIDNSPSSPHEGNIYDAWTDFNNGNDIYFTRSTNNGVSYTTPINLSSAIGGGSHDQGVNIQTGPNGEVYVTWTIYDSWPSDETALGFIKSTDGGATFGTPVRIISNIRGIRNSATSKNHRVNSFPSMTVDISGGPENGSIYIVWTNVGVPGTNTGTNRSVYMIKSSDGGVNWAAPIRVNQGNFQDGKEAYFPWIVSDPESGVLSTIFYDDRNVSSNQVETWVSNSYDGGATWEDFRVSDVAFTPQPISGLASGYMGDYLGISARGGYVYPVWADNRNGYVQTFVSPFETNTREKPEDLTVVLTNDVTGQTDLTWTFAGAPSFQHFVVYRDGTEIDTTTDQFYTDMLPAFGLYNYTVTAMHDDGESSGVNGSVQWGNPLISVDPTSLEETLAPDETSVRTLTITNTGQLDLVYNINTEITNSPEPIMPICDASGGGNDEFISRVQFGTIDNSSAQTFYGDYTNLSTDVEAGATYPITITNGQIFSSDDLGIWIDFNQDEDFDDPGEEVVCSVNDGADGTYSITIPDDALGGMTTMRIRIKFNGSDCGSPCGTTTWGEVEDYSVNINSWLQVDTNEGVITPGSTEIINVNFDSTGLELGDYFASIFIGSNASNTPLVEVPVTLHVVEDGILQTTATADDDEICVGTSTTLHANPNGGSGTYTYSWSSVPTGFNSTLENPTASPLVNTVYTVVVNDGVDSESSSVTVNVIDLPAQANMPSGDDNLCQDADSSTYTTNAVPNTTFYDWSLTPAAAGTITGTTTSASVDWDAAFTGNATITVTANNDCGPGLDSQALSVTINELPTVTLDGFDDVCIDEPPFELVGGSPAGGSYSGVGVSGGFFDPLDAGIGIHSITYAYADANGCENFAVQNIEVNPLPVVTLSPFADVFDTDPPLALTGGDPVGGEYSGPGVTGGIFDPAVAGVGIHTITYSFIDVNGCENFATETIEVIELIGVNDFENGINFVIYPNPNQGLLNLELNSTFVNDFEVKVVNQLGAIIFTRNISVADASEFSFNLSSLANGVYYFLLNSDKQNYAKKIIVNN